MTEVPVANNALPVGWLWRTLGQLGSWYGGGTPSKSNPDYWINGTIPWVSPKDMKRQRISGAEDYITEDALKASAARLIPSGAVLIVTRSGILEHTLPLAITSCAVAVNQDLKALVPDLEIAYPDFIYYALRSAENRILHACSKSGTTVASLSFNLLAAYQVPIPPLAEQRRIVEIIEECFSRLESADKIVAQALSESSRLRAVILAKAFDGRFTKENANSDATP